MKAATTFWTLLSTAVVFLAVPPVFASTWQSIGPQGDIFIRKIDLDSVSFEGLNKSTITYRINYESIDSRYNSLPIRTVIANCQSRERIEITNQNDESAREFKKVYPGTINDIELNVACARISYATAPQPPSIEPLPPSERQSPTEKGAQTDLTKVPRVHSTGSGFVVSKNTVVTNNHVVDGCTGLFVRYRGIETFAKLIGKTEKSDLALISTQNGFNVTAAVRNTASLGEDVMVAGYPLTGILGTDLIVTGGQINSLAGLRNDPTLLQISAPVQPGNSGGPLIDKGGDVVGVVVSKLNVEKIAKITGDMTQNINFAIKPEVLKLFLDANQVNYAVARSSKRLDGVEIAQRARDFTVQIICYK